MRITTTTVIIHIYVYKYMCVCVYIYIMSFKATAMSIDFQQWGKQPRMARSAQKWEFG